MEVEMGAARAHVSIYGRVQGVFFRYETRLVANSLGLFGWVKNKYDGTVEAVFEGEREKVEKVVDWCRRGPRHAYVEKIDVDWEEPKGETSFTIDY